MIDLTHPYISIIIPSYNSFRTITKTIEKILTQDSYNKIKEIIIVDSSDDEITNNILDKIKLSSIVKVINSGIKIMPAVQRNIGAYNAKGQLLVFIDSDAYPASDWLCGIQEAYSKGYVVGGGSYLIENNQTKIKHIIAQYYFEFGEFIPIGEIRKKKTVPSCNLFCDKELFYKVNGFPIVRASEDTMFCLNINNYKTLYFFPQIKVYHIFRENIHDSRRNMKLLGKYIIIYRKFSLPHLYRNKICLIAIFPFIVFYKFTKVYSRTIIQGPVHFFKINKAFINYLQCVALWSFGVLQGIFCNINEKN